jgi:undecaprenyl-diphosphatase
MSVSGGLKAGGGPTSFWHRQVRPNLAAWIGWVRRAPRGRRRPHLWLRPGRVAVGAMVTVAILAVVVVVLDASAIRTSLTAPQAVRSFFDTVTDFGKGGWILWPAGLVLVGLAVFTAPSRGRFATGVVAAVAVRLTFVFAAVAIPGLFTAIVKRLIGRARPLIEGAADPYRYDPLVWKAAYASLPSGHATTAFAAAIAIGSLWPQTRPYVWVYALLVAVSRVAVTAHFPSDVLAGAVVGTVGALLVRDWFAARRLGFSVDADGRVRRLPSPSWRRIKTVARRLGGA